MNHSIKMLESIAKLARLIRTACSVITQTRGRALKTLVQTFGFLVKLQKLGWVFERIPSVFWNKYSAEYFTKNIFWKSSLYIDWNLIWSTFLTLFSPMFPFYTPWKQQKANGFLVFSGGIKWKHWPGIG